MLSHNERRNFPRVPCRASGELETTAGRWPVQLVDLSFSGALVVSTLGKPPSLSELLTLYVHLAPGQEIKMRGNIVRAKGDYMALDCQPAGVDHRAQLRKLFT